MPLPPPASIDPTALTAALREALPADQRHLAAELAAAIAAYVGGTSRNEPDAQLRPALEALAGQDVASGGRLIHFPENAQLGEVRVGDMAGRDINKPTYNTTIVLPTAQQPPTPVDAARQDLIAAVRANWITGVLDQSLYHQVRIALGLSSDPQRVELPFRAQVREMGGPTRDLPPETRMRDLYDTHRGALLILGAPGGGKTTLLLELARDLLSEADRGLNALIPVVFNLASWAERREPLEHWIVGELRQRYGVRQSDAERWLATHALRPFLDGLDEVAEEHQSACVAAINAFREQHGRMPPVVAMRNEDYARLEAGGHKLALQAAIAVQRLSDAQVLRFFAEAGAGLAGLREAWERDAVLRELADTPLMLSVLATVYQDKDSNAVPQVGDVEQRRAVVFDAYIDAVFERRGEPRYSKDNTVRYLGWLADKLRQDDRSVFYIEEMQPEWMNEADLKRSYFTIVWAFLGVTGGIGLIAFIALFSFTGGSDGRLYSLGMTSLLLLSLIASFWSFYKKDRQFYMRARIPVTVIDRLRWSWQKALLGSRAGFGFIAHIGREFRRPLSIIGLLTVGMAFTPGGWRASLGLLILAVMLYGGIALLISVVGAFLQGIQPIEEPKLRTRPNQGIRATSLNMAYAFAVVSVGSAIVLAVIYAAWGVFITSLISHISDAPMVENVNYWLVAGGGALIGLMLGGIGGMLTAPAVFGAIALVGHALLRIAVTRAGVAPWNYAAFLEHCAERILMQRIGGGFAFVHLTFRDHLADRHATTQPTAEPRHAEPQTEP